MNNIELATKNNMETGHGDDQFIHEALARLTERRINERALADKAKKMGRDFFTDEEVSSDIRKCEEKARRFTAEGAKAENYKETVEMGHMAEYVFYQAIENYGWLAPKEKVHLIITSLFDDYIRGIDSVIQIIMGDGKFDHFGLAVDFTTSEQDIGYKLKVTFDSLDNGFCPSVKYFDSDKTGPLKNFKVPRLVIAADGRTIQRLSDLCEEIIFDSSVSDESKRALVDDVFKYSFYLQIRLQLMAFIARLEKVAEKAQREKRSEIKNRAEETLARHQQALVTLDVLEKENNINIDTISSHMKDGKGLIGTMSKALRGLSMTPIEF